MRILNLGSLNIDKTYKVSHFVEPKETIKTLEYKEFCGGKGLNQSIALSKAGAKVYHAGCMGKDGDVLLEFLADKQVNTEHIRKSERPSGHAIIQVDEEGQNSILICGGANEDVTKNYIDAVLEEFGREDMLLVQNEVSNVAYAIKRAAVKGMRITFNPSPINEEIDACDLCKVDYFIVNEVEGKYLAGTGSDDPQIIMDKLKKRFPKAGIVLTLGEKGAYYSDEAETIYQKSYKMNVVDTTGAGDTFTGFFLAGIAEGRRMEESLRLASIAAGISVGRPGAASSIPDMEEVNAVFRQERLLKKSGDS